MEPAHSAPIPGQGLRQSQALIGVEPARAIKAEPSSGVPAWQIVSGMHEAQPVGYGPMQAESAFDHAVVRTGSRWHAYNTGITLIGAHMHEYSTDILCQSLQ